MKNFGRVLRLSLRYRFSFLASAFCALCVGVLWGGNIAPIYPFVEVAFQGESVHEWIDSRINEAEATAAEFAASIPRLEQQCAEALPDQRHAIRAKIELADDRIQAEKQAAGRYRWLKPYIVAHLPDDPFRTLALFIGLLLVGTLLKSLFLIAHNVLVARLSQLGTFQLRKLFFRRTLRLDVTTFDRDGISDLMSRFTHDMEHVATGMKAVFGRLVCEPLKMAACLICAGVICWRLLLLSLVIAPPAAFLIRWLAGTLKRANRRAMEEMALLYNTLEEAFRGIKVVKSFTMERQERTRFHGNSKKYYRKSMRIARYNSLAHPMTEILGIIAIGLAMLAGAYLVLGGKTHLFGIRMSPRPLSLGLLFWFYGSLVGAADPARKLSAIFTQLQRAAAAADRVYALLDRRPQVRDPQRPRPLPRHHEDLVFDGVDFAYLPGRPVLAGIDLEIAFGETIGIVGPSGCGKSTLVSLIPRFIDPGRGTIRLDGVPLRDVRLRDLRSQIGLVTQEPLLFDDTILNNVRYGSPHATVEQVVDAAKQAHAHRFIESELAEGYQTVVGPMGAQLSGGQRQRIALARAILRDPAILILDEATSQIDLESERIIHRVLDRFVRGRTVVLVTHRLSALALADRIAVIHDGRVLDIGTQSQLLARCDFYRRLYQIQFDDLRETA